MAPLAQVVRLTIRQARAVEAAQSTAGHEILNKVCRARLSISLGRRGLRWLNEREGLTVLAVAFTFAAYFAVLGAI